MSFWKVAPEPSTSLGRYRILSPLAGVRVSPIQLGGMSIGDQWDKIGMGAMDRESSFRLLDAYFDAGGNFIDTSGNYQNESSEILIGEWAEKRGIRDQLVIATKYSTPYKDYDETIKVQANYGGNNAKNLKLSVESSLRKLRTSYIDILYLHFWDFSTSVEEVMNNLHNLVTSGRVVYLGISDTPAWIVADCNRYAKMAGKTPFVIYQGAWNIMERSFERDIIPMARAHGLALAPWGVLQGGKFRTDAEEKRRLESGENGRTAFQPEWLRNEEEKKMCAALEKVAKEVGAKHITSIAIAYLMHKTTYVFPILGGRKVEQLMDNIEALDITLSPEQMNYLESNTQFSPGFPNWFIGDGTKNSPLLLQSCHEDRVQIQQPIKPTDRVAVTKYTMGNT